MIATSTMPDSSLSATDKMQPGGTTGEPTGEPNPSTPSSISRFKPASQKTPKSTASRSRDTRLPSSRTTSVFDRLYKTQTAASKAWTPVRSQVRRTTGGRTPGSHTPKVRRSRRVQAGSVDDELQVFNRLHITGTISNTRKHSTPTKKFSAPRVSAARSPHKTTLLTPLSTPGSATRRTSSTRFVYSPRMKPLTKLYFDSKYHPGLGLETVDPIKLGFSFFQSFCDYENGELDSQGLAREIIVAFFKKDFPAGRHWELHEPTVEVRAGEEHSYRVEMSATYDWEDGYQVARAKGVVSCLASQKEVRVLNYVYNVSTYP